jgi:hypothetical protein
MAGIFICYGGLRRELKGVHKNTAQRPQEKHPLLETKKLLVFET